MIPLNYLSASAFQIVRGISCFKTGVSPQRNQINQLFKTSASALRKIRNFSCLDTQDDIRADVKFLADGTRHLERGLTFPRHDFADTRGTDA